MKKLYFITFTLLISLSAFAQGYKPEDKAIDFKLKNIDGTTLSLKDLPNTKGFIVIFTCNHCPYAVAYEDRIIALDKKYKSMGYPVVAINPNDTLAYPSDSFSEMQKRAKEKSFTFPYLIDETQEIAKTYGATKTPHVYILNKEDAQLVVKYIGTIDNNYENASAVTVKYIEDAINLLLANKKVTTKTTKAIGCSIKWKNK